MPTLDQLASQIRFHLEQLSERNAHHEFEHLCRYLARARICSNILPATGPVSSLGDQGRDFETFRTYLNESPISKSSFIGMVSEGPIAFACTLIDKKSIETKIKSDVETIMKSGTSVVDIHYFCTADISSGVRHTKLHAWAKDKFNVLLEIHDGQAISEHLTDQDIFWIAVRFLNIPSELYPTIPSEDEERWYYTYLRKWKEAEQSPINYADFSEIKAAVRYATFEDAAKKDLPFWIELFEALINSTTYSLLKRRSIYEIAVASLRGLGSMIGYEDRVANYFNDIPNLSSPSDLEDALNLWNYCFGSLVHNASQFNIDDLLKWQTELTDKVDLELQNTDNPGRRCLLLQTRGFLYLVPKPDQDDETRIEITIESWLELASLVDRAPLFPLDEFADRLTQVLELSEYFSLIGDDSRFEQITSQIDEKLTIRHGSFVAAEKCQNRAMALYNQGKLIRAIKEIHKAKIKWFANETLRGSIIATLFISNCYFELNLAFAAKYYALAAAHIADISDDERIKHYIPTAIIEAASCDYSLGAYCGFIDLSELGLNTLNAFQSNSDDLGLENVIHKSVFHFTLIRTIAAKLDSDLQEYIDEFIESWESLEEYFDELIPVADKAWANKDISEMWAEIEKQTSDRPFSDFGQNRAVSFEALGVIWLFSWENTYELNMLAEEILAVFQILIADLANIDLCLMRTSVEVEISFSADNQVNIRQMPSNEISLWNLAVPQNCVMEDLGDVALGLATSLLEYASLLPDERFFEIIETAFSEGLSEKIFFGQRYGVLFRKFIGKDSFERFDRQSRVKPMAHLSFQPLSHDELSWVSDPGPGYSKENAVIALNNRYQLSVLPIRYTIKSLSKENEFLETIRILKADGWLDWHILSAVSLLVINYRLKDKVNFHENPIQAQKRFYEYMNTPETDNAMPVLISEFSEQNLRFHLNLSMVSTIKGCGLEIHQSTPDFDAISDFLGKRYQYWTDDIDHPDYGF